MQSISSEFLALTQKIAANRKLPRISHVVLPSDQSGVNSPRQMEKPAKFALLVLQDNSAGLFYTLDVRSDGHYAKARALADRLVGQSVDSVIKQLMNLDPLAHAFAMAAFNALSDHCFRQLPTDPRLNAITDDDKSASNLGMVGYFPPLIRQLKSRGQAVTVIERDTSLVGEDGCIRVTLDAQELERCDQIICTASTLLNNSLEQILQYRRPGVRFSLIGPTAGGLPDPLFARGVDQIGATMILDVASLSEKLQRSEPWRDSTRKYVLTPELYPGIDVFLN